MTLQEAKEILKTKPKTNEEIALFKIALALVSTSWVKIPTQNE